MRALCAAWHLQRRLFRARCRRVPPLPGALLSWLLGVCESSEKAVAAADARHCLRYFDALVGRLVPPRGLGELIPRKRAIARR